MRFLVFAFIHSLGVCTFARGISKQKPLTEWRAFDSPLVEIPCKMPGDKGQDRWNDRDDCITQIRTSKNTLPGKVMQAARLRAKACKPPDIVNSLPDRLRRKVLKIWEERDPKGDCWQQQRRTRLILLNLPPSLRKSVRPQALQCSLPHFIDRLEWDLQVQLRRLWASYKEGEPCSRLVAKQLRLLQQHDISIESFEMPPPTMFRRFQVLRKLRKSNMA